MLSPTANVVPAVRQATLRLVLAGVVRRPRFDLDNAMRSDNHEDPMERSMKRLLAAVVVIATTGVIALAQGGVEKAVLDLEQQWVKAGLASNGAALAPLLATDFVSLQADGTMQTKTVYVANTSKAKWQVNAVSDMKVQVHGDSAVVIGIWTGKGTDGTGKAYDGRERFADTWVKMPDGKWQCVTSASVTLK